MMVVPGRPRPAQARSTIFCLSMAQLSAWRKATSLSTGLPRLLPS